MPSIGPLLLDDEKIINVYTALRDYMVFTDKRIIAVNVQGFTGSKKDFTSMPYKVLSDSDKWNKLPVDALNRRCYYIIYNLERTRVTFGPRVFL